MANPNIKAWRVADERETAESIAKTPDLQAAIPFLQRIKSGAVAVPER